MELYTIRYNLHNYINKDNFDYKNTKEYIYLWKYTLITIFIFLGIIFIYKFKEIKTIGFIIIFIFILFIYIIYFEIGILIDNIEKNKYLKEYGDYYEFSNIIFNETFDFIEDNLIINFVKDNSQYNELLEFLLEYERVKRKIKYNMKYEDNKTNEEINDYYYNQIKKNNDLLKYIDVYKLKYVNKYLFIKDNKNELENEQIIKKYTIEKNKYYLINLEELNKINIKYKKILLEYINLKYEQNFKNFNLLFDNFDVRKSRGIKKIIDDYNYNFIKIIVISIIVITIICHIFYTELLRW